MSGGLKIHFDAQSARFAALSELYRAAITAADELRRRLAVAEKRGHSSRARRLEAELLDAEARIDTAFRAVTAHTRRTRTGPSNERNRFPTQARSRDVA